MAEAEVQVRKGREGNRWVNERPSGEEVSAWFKDAVDWPEGLDAANYVGGVTLIEGSEKAKEPRGFKDDGTPLFTELYNLVFTPYVKVETRVQFFHDLCALNPEWEAYLEPVPQPEWASKLPPGFSKVVVSTGTDRATSFICSTMKVTIYKRGTVRYESIANRRTGEVEVVRRGEVVKDAPPATKMIPLLNSGADPMSLMKAETGAVGRALGMAGMLIVPGAGIASAEDMREAQAFEVQLASAREEIEPGPAAEGKAALDASLEPTHDELVALATATINELKKASEPQHQQFIAWVQERGFQGKLSEKKDAELKQIAKKAEAEVKVATSGAEEAAPSDA